MYRKGDLVRVKSDENSKYQLGFIDGIAKSPLLGNTLWVVQLETTAIEGSKRKGRPEYTYIVVDSSKLSLH